MDEKQNRYLKIIIGFMTVTTVVLLCYGMKHTLSCFLLSFIIAYLLDPIVIFLNKRISRRKAIITLYFLLAILSAFALFYLIPLLTMHFNAFVKDIPTYIQELKGIIQTIKSKLMAAPGSEEWEWLLNYTSNNIDTFINVVWNFLYRATSRFAINILSLIIAPILVFFMLLYKEEIKNGIKYWLPSDKRDGILEFGNDVNKSVGNYIRGQFIVSLIVASVSTIVLVILGVNHPLLNGIFAGLASIIPFIGFVLAVIPPLFFAYVQFQSGAILLQVTIAFIIIYFAEGYLIKPFVFKEAMNLNPLTTIIVVMGFGELMGFWGILLALPIAATIKILSQRLKTGGFSKANPETE